MRREIQINYAAIGYTEETDLHFAAIQLAERGFKAGAAWADQHPNWISVEDELPKENGKTKQSICVWATDGLISGEFRYNFDTKTWTDMWGDPFNITHWMPLPQAPKKGGNHAAEKD